MDFHVLVVVFAGAAWTLAYIDAIRVGLRDRSYAMPFWALSLNLAWEVMHAIYGYAARGTPGYAELGMGRQVVVTSVWALFDLGILYTYLRFGQAESPFPRSKVGFVAWTICSLVASFVIQYAFIDAFGRVPGAVYSAYTQNVLISVGYVEMRRRRGSSLGQSKLIAYAKWLGTLSLTIYRGFFFRGKIENYPNNFIIIVGTVCALYDMYYIYLMHFGDEPAPAPRATPDAPEAAGRAR